MPKLQTILYIASIIYIKTHETTKSLKKNIIILKLTHVYIVITQKIENCFSSIENF